ncbi:MAG: homoserine dehydrogenase [Saprospiraceae bacterium]
MNTNTINIGLAGFGTVGKAFFELLQSQPRYRPVSVLIKDTRKHRCLLPSLLTDDVNDFFSAKPQVVVEALSDTPTALKLAVRCLRAGKTFITANKDLVARHGRGLRALEQEHGGTLLYEAACGAAVPIVRTIDTFFNYEPRPVFQGILNSTTNFILDKQQRVGLSFEDALSLAQQSGLAEANPARDLSGVDAACKLCILLKHLYGTEAEPEQLVYCGIDNWGLPRWLLNRVRLIGTILPKNSAEVVAYVLPTLVQDQSQWLDVSNEQNAFEIAGAAGERHFLKGNGAGGKATATALLNDLNAAASGYRYGHSRGKLNWELTSSCNLDGILVYDDWEKVPDDFFLQIESRYSGRYLHFIEGRFNLNSLKNAYWWKQPGVFLAAKEPLCIMNDEQSETLTGEAAKELTPELINAF